MENTWVTSSARDEIYIERLESELHLLYNKLARASALIDDLVQDNEILRDTIANFSMYGRK